MTAPRKPISLDDAIFPEPAEASEDVKAWQDRKIKAGLADADAGRFASPDAVKAVIQKYIPDG